MGSYVERRSAEIAELAAFWSSVLSGVACAVDAGHHAALNTTVLLRKGRD